MTIREDLTSAIKGLSDSKVCELEENISETVDALHTYLDAIERGLEYINIIVDTETKEEIKSELHNLHMSI